MTVILGNGELVDLQPERISLPVRTVEVTPAHTVSQADFILGRRYQDPYALFDDTPIEEVRLVCIKHFRNEYNNADYWRDHSYWMETRIGQLMKLKDLLWENLLQAYLFPLSESMSVHERALRFAVHVGRQTEVHHSTFVKHVAGKVKHNPKWAFKIEELEVLWHHALDRLIPGADMPHRYYHQDNWFNAERALSVIALSLDTRFTQRIKVLLDLHASGSIRPASPDLFLRSKNQSVLAETYERLQHVTEVRFRKLEKCILQMLGFKDEHMASAEGSIHAACRFPTRTWSSEEPVAFTFYVKTVLPEHLERQVPEILRSIQLSWTPSAVWRGTGTYQPFSAFQTNIHDDILRFEAIPTEKKNRFTLTITTEGVERPIETVKGTIEVPDAES